MRILVVDDHPFVRKGLIHVMQQGMQGEELQADEADSFDSAEQLLQTDSRYDLVLLDISLGGKSGIELLKSIRQKTPELPVLVVSMHPEDQYAVRTIRMGAAGYLSKHSAPDELNTAIHQILEYGTYLSPNVSRLIAEEFVRSGKPSNHALLSNREMEIANLVASGLRMKQIADDLGLSIKTVSTHRSRLLKKLNLANNAELTAYFMRNGLLQ